MAVITSVQDNLIYYYLPNLNSAFIKPMYVKTDIVPIMVLSLVTLLANGILRVMTSTHSFALWSLYKDLYLFQSNTPQLAAGMETSPRTVVN